MNDLDPRKQTILRAVVFEYVQAAEPIGSEMLTQKYQLGVKSATVRNELAEMAEMGYLEQPHTSAGRIPSDQGYRYYVDRLITQREPDEASKQRLREVADDGEALQALLGDVTRVLSRLTHLLTAATTVRDANLTVRTAVLSALGPTQALLVLVLNNAHVENRMIECPAGLTLQDIGLVNELLTAQLQGKTLRQIARARAPQAPGNAAAERMLTQVWADLRSIARSLTRGALIVDGEEYMFAQPEFQNDLSSLTELMDTLIESDVLYETLASQDGPQLVTIGREHRHEDMRQLSVVRQTFTVGGSDAGIIALIGPTRMSYDTSIPLVNFTARALSDSLSRFFG